MIVEAEKLVGYDGQRDVEESSSLISTTADGRYYRQDIAISKLSPRTVGARYSSAICEKLQKSFCLASLTVINILLEVSAVTLSQYL